MGGSICCCCGNKKEKNKQQMSPEPKQHPQVALVPEPAAVVEHKPKPVEVAHPVEDRREVDLLVSAPLQPPKQEETMEVKQRRKFDEYVKLEKEAYKTQQSLSQSQITQANFVPFTDFIVNENQKLGPSAALGRFGKFGQAKDIFLEEGKFNIITGELFQKLGNFKKRQLLNKGNASGNSNSYLLTCNDQNFHLKIFNGVDLQKFEKAMKLSQEYKIQSSEEPLGDFKMYIGSYKEEGATKGIGNFYLLSKLEQYNLMTFSNDLSLTDKDRAIVSEQVCKAVFRLAGQLQQTAMELDIKMSFVKPTNILISKTSDGWHTQISDWQFCCKYFKDIYEPINLNSNVQIGYAPKSLNNEDSNDQLFFIKTMLLMMHFRINLSLDLKTCHLHGRREFAEQEIQQEEVRGGRSSVPDQQKSEIATKAFYKFLHDKSFIPMIKLITQLNEKNENPEEKKKRITLYESITSATNIEQMRDLFTSGILRSSG